MISDEKRREVASNLRESREFISGLPKATLEQNAFVTFDRILACVDYEHGNIFDYLADLIDVPTTVLDLTETTRTVHGEEVRGWECRECGQSCEEMYGEYEYCPHCRRKVERWNWKKEQRS